MTTMDRRNFLRGVAVAVVAPVSVIPVPALATGVEFNGILIKGVVLKGSKVPEDIQQLIMERIRELTYESLKKEKQFGSMKGEYTFPVYVPQKVEPFVGPPRHKPLHTWID